MTKPEFDKMSGNLFREMALKASIEVTDKR